MNAMNLSNRFEKWILSGLATLACASVFASAPVSQTDEDTSLHLQERFSALTAEEKQIFSGRIKDMRSLAKARLEEANALEEDLDQPGNCGGVKSKRGCLREQARELARAGKDPSEPEQILNHPQHLRQSASQLNEIAEVGDEIRSNKTLGDSLINEASGVYATYRDSWKYMVQKDALIAITVGMTGYTAAKPFSDKVSAHFNDPANKWTGAKYQIGNFLGQGYTVLVPVWLAAKYTEDEKLSKMADNWVAGSILDGLITAGLKYTVREKRPDGSDNLGFPSGHATTAFMMAKIVQDEMGSPWSVPAYVLASYVGMSRIGGAKHTMGQVAVGAGLGYAIGSAVEQASAEHRTKEQMSGHFRVGDTKVEYHAMPTLIPSGTNLPPGARITVEGVF
jgi:hypothetical protein